MKYQEIISVGNTGWEAEAEQLALRRQAFVLVGWRFSFDNELCTQIAKRFSYSYRFKPDEDRAFFEPTAKN
jgi:hypothetical protein